MRLEQDCLNRSFYYQVQGVGVGGTPVVPALGRLGKEERAFKGILCHIASST